MPTAPAALSEQYIVTGIVVFVIFSAAVSFWYVVRHTFAELRQWQSEESEKTSCRAAAESQKQREWQDQQSRQWQAFLSRQEKPIADLVTAVQALTVRVETGFTKIEGQIDAHDSRVDLRIGAAEDRATAYDGPERRTKGMRPRP